MLAAVDEFLLTPFAELESRLRGKFPEGTIDMLFDAGGNGCYIPGCTGEDCLTLAEIWLKPEYQGKGILKYILTRLACDPQIRHLHVSDAHSLGMQLAMLNINMDGRQFHNSPKGVTDFTMCLQYNIPRLAFYRSVELTDPKLPLTEQDVWID